MEYNEVELNKMLGSLIVISNYDAATKTMLTAYFTKLVEAYNRELRENQKKGI